MNTDEWFQEKREDILQIAARNGVSDVRLASSGASNQEGSDLDFLVEMKPGYGFLYVAGLAMELEEVLDRKIRIMTKKGLKCHIRTREH